MADKENLLGGRALEMKAMFTTHQKIWLAVAVIFFIANMVVVTILAVRMRNNQGRKTEDSENQKQSLLMKPAISSDLSDTILRESS